MGRCSVRLDDRHARADLSPDRGGGHTLSRRRAPERLPGIVDSHAHLQHSRFDGELEAVLDRATEAGIERILVPGWDVASSEAAVAMAQRHAPLIDAAVGVHPHDAARTDEAGWRHIEALVAEPSVVAVGEIGLDYFRNLSPPEAQREALDRQLALAATRDLPVLVHDRDAHADVMASLLAWGGRRAHPVRGVLHAFSGDGAMAMRLAPEGFLVSFALPVAFRSATGPREAAVGLPDGTFLVETDSPYLGPDRDLRNEPTTVRRVAAELARLRGSSAEAIAEQVGAAYRRLAG